MARPELECCRPHSAYSPSGFAWVHADDCPVDPKQKVRIAKPEGEPEARERHPAGSARPGHIRAWLLSPLIGPLSQGAAYADHWIDRGEG